MSDIDVQSDNKLELENDQSQLNHSQQSLEADEPQIQTSEKDQQHILQSEQPENEDITAYPDKLDESVPAESMRSHRQEMSRLDESVNSLPNHQSQQEVHELPKIQESVQKVRGHKVASVPSQAEQIANDVAQMNMARNQLIEQLQNINLKLRTKIKDLNQQVEKALERQQKRVEHQGGDRQFDLPKIQKGDMSPSGGANKAKDPAYMLKIRQKEIANARKQIEYNNVQIDKLRKILEKLGISPNAEPGTTETVPTAWEERYKNELEKKANLERKIYQLEKDNITQSHNVDKNPNTEEQQMKLKALLEDLRVWKQKVVQTSNVLAREQATRHDQSVKIKEIQEENSKYMTELQELQKKSGIDVAAQNAKIQKAEKEQDQKRMQEEIDKVAFMEKMEENFKTFKAKERQIEKQKEDLNTEFEFLKKQLKEKQQLHRISSYKLNELKRSIKTKMKEQAYVEKEKDEIERLQREGPSVPSEDKKFVKPQANRSKSPMRASSVLRGNPVDTAQASVTPNIGQTGPDMKYK